MGAAFNGKVWLEAILGLKPSMKLLTPTRQNVSLCLVGADTGWAEGLVLLGSSSIREGPFCDITMRLLILG